MGRKSEFKELLGYIVFKYNGLRVGLELTLCIVLYQNLVFLGAVVGNTQSGLHIFAWFTSCIFVALLDQLILAAPVRLFRETYNLEHKSQFQDALVLLDSLSQGFIPCPDDIYIERKIEILTSAGSFEEASELIESSEELNELTTLRLKARVTAVNDLEKAIEMLQETESSVLQLEKAFLLKKSDAKSFEKKNAFKEVIDAPLELHPAGETTHTMAFAYYQSSRLWTGHAEEALPALEDAISRIRTSAIYMPALRPYLAELYAEKSYYLATHREPYKAMNDLSIARALSKQDGLIARYSQIEEELQARHGIDPGAEMV